MNNRTTFILILTLLSAIKISAEDAEYYFKKGNSALINNCFEEAKAYYTKAANLGSGEACGMLAHGYLFSVLGDGGDYTANMQNAIDWADKGLKLNDPTSQGVMGTIQFIVADTDKEKVEALPTLLLAYEGGALNDSYIGNLITTCLLIQGKTDLAMLWSQKIMDAAKESNYKGDYFMAAALLSKAYLNKKDYINALSTAVEPAEDGNPIALYVMGKSQIKSDIYPDAGRERVKTATQYSYDSILDIDAFQDEILKYYNSIKDKNF